MLAVLWSVVGLAVFAAWITGYWFGAVAALSLASVLCFTGGAIWPQAGILFVLAVAPFIVRRFVMKPRAERQGAAFELRAFWPFPGFNKRF